MCTESFWKYFFEIFEDLPRQGPGTRESTERALGMVPPLSADQRILDVGCGTGAQTLDLARACPAQIVAVDNHAAFVDALARRTAELGLADRIETRVADMHDLPFSDGSFDLIWSEGAIFIMGFAQGIAAWRRLLRPGGHLVVSEYCWFTDDPPAELVEMHFDGCPEAGDLAARRSAVAANGYRLLGEFRLPEAGWWDNFYDPMGPVLARFRERHAAKPEALAVADHCQQEIDLCRRHAGTFGYVFFVMQPGEETVRR